MYTCLFLLMWLTSLFLFFCVVLLPQNTITSFEAPREAAVRGFFFVFFFRCVSGSARGVPSISLLSWSWRFLSCYLIWCNQARRVGSKVCLHTFTRSGLSALISSFAFAFFYDVSRKKFFFLKSRSARFREKNILKRQPVNTILHAYAAYGTHRQVVHVRVNIWAGCSFYEGALILGSATVSQYLRLCRNYRFNLLATPFTSLASLRLATAFS